MQEFGTKTLEFSRQKPRRWWLSLYYRLFKISTKFLGAERVLRFLLNMHFVSERLSWESICSLYKDEAFTNHNLVELMSRWVRPGSKIIDIGCGNGRLSVEASKYGSVVAIDQVDAFRDAPGIDFRVGDVMDVDEEFDVAILSHILEHLDNPEKLLMSVRADLILVEVPNFDHDGRNRYRLRLGLPFYTDDDHVREYTLETLTHQLIEAGWQIREKIVDSAISLVAARKVL